MRKWFDYGKIKSIDLFNSLDKQEQNLVRKFKDYVLISACEQRSEEAIREVLRFKRITDKPFNKVKLEDLRYFLKELKQSNFADHTKNKIKDFVNRFLKWNFKDWSERFNEFDDIKINSDAQRKKEITDKQLLSEKDIKKLLDAEPSLYWKTFLMTQAEGFLRTKECRELKWSQIDFEDDGFTTLNIPSKKNQTGTTKINPVVIKIAGRFLKELKEQQRKYEIKTEWVFPSPKNANKPISKSVNLWFNNLCKNTLGRSANNYLLRHSGGTRLQEKVRKGELSKDNAVQFMRHSEKMFDKSYSHMSRDDIKQLIKKQIYNTKELTKEDIDEIKKLKEIQEEQNKKIEKMDKTLKKSLDTSERAMTMLEMIQKKYPEVYLEK
ncbi:MAG: tyrosine-type recombinase/integrase [Nanoarchaeota archaeon]